MRSGDALQGVATCCANRLCLRALSAVLLLLVRVLLMFWFAAETRLHRRLVVRLEAAPEAGGFGFCVFRNGQGLAFCLTVGDVHNDLGVGTGCSFTLSDGLTAIGFCLHLALSFKRFGLRIEIHTSDYA